jgi:hypothetical protein
MALLEDIAPQQTFAEGEAFQPIEQPKEVPRPPQTPEDETALRIVVQDTLYTERWLESKMLPLEWLRYDRLYQFKVPAQFWEGTNIPRANLGIPLVYEHVESILPQVMAGLFSDDPPFMSEPRPGTSMQAARANDALLAWELDRVNFKEEIRLGAKSALIYGVGIWKWGWHSYTKKRTEYRRKQSRRFLPAGALGGVMVDQDLSDEVEAREVEEEVNEPTFEYVNIRHVLVDPGCRVSDIRKAKFVVHRLYLTLLDLEELAGREGYNIPPIERLKQVFFPPKEKPLAGSIETSTIDMNSEFRAMPRNLDSTVDPLNQPLEVLEYWTADRVYTVVQRKLVIRNQANEFGRIPFLSACFSDVLDSFYGMGIAKLVGGEQRLQQGTINTFLDDLSLSLNGMFVRVRGKNTPTQQLRMRPGGIIDTDDDKGIGILQRQPIQLEVGAVMASSDSRAQRRTAANEMVVQGSLPSDKSSITRTATGVQALTGGSGARLQYFVENIASQVFVPFLRAIHAMNGRYLKPSQIERILTKELNQAYQGDTIDLINAQVNFNVLAASKLQARRSMSSSLPLMFQFLLTEPVMNSLQVEGKKVNVAELVNMLFQVTGWPNKQDVIVSMTPQDQQRAMLNNPAVQQMMAQQGTMQAQEDSKMRLLEEENVARAGRDVIRSLLKQAEAPIVGAQTVNYGR